MNEIECGRLCGVMLRELGYTYERASERFTARVSSEALIEQLRKEYRERFPDRALPEMD